MSDRDALLVIKGIVDAQLAGDPTPAPTPTPTPAPQPVPVTHDYSPWTGNSRSQVEYKAKHGYAPKLPEWFDWEEAYASGHVIPDADYAPPATGGSGHDRRSLYWPAPGASALFNFDGAQGASFFPSFDVPPGWRGSMAINVRGERGGARIDSLKAVVSDGRGIILASGESQLGAVNFDSIPVDRDLGTVMVHVTIQGAGGSGYVQLNVYPR